MTFKASLEGLPYHSGLPSHSGAVDDLAHVLLRSLRCPTARDLVPLQYVDELGGQIHLSAPLVVEQAKLLGEAALDVGPAVL